MVVGPAAFVALGVLILVMPDPGAKGIIAGVLCVVFFGACLVIGPWMLFGKPMILTVDGDGIRSQRQGFEFDWPAVTGVYVVTQKAGFSTQTHLAVDGAPRVARGYMRKLGQINASLVQIPASASAGTVTWVAGTAPSIDGALAAIHAFAPRVPIFDRR
ncbi:hypothetical protein FK268_02830 [Tsukamurella sputi]|uniref:PH domain-containing protein n=1 Tax=Tsukamurella sputi TaxID=2591848 RepID=A0A5C5RSX6_9ACTN|nr:hypothetical protein [Tsukamurella sputi]TWS26196.1 hypothetical protein FK268_02830 [Tsukamurella sputi]